MIILPCAGWAAAGSRSGAAAPAQPGARKSLIEGIKSWGYQLQKLNLRHAAGSPYDLLVIDAAALDYGPRNWGKQALAGLKRKPDGSRRFVLAYLSIGEAEAYRSYWQKNWVAPRAGSQAGPVASNRLPTGPAPQIQQPPASQTGAGTGGNSSRLSKFAIPDLTDFTAELKTPLQFPTAVAPAWLGFENASWRGNYHVRFWQQKWQKLIIGTPASVVDRLIAAGFDGVYLDRADAYEAWLHERADAPALMRAFITDIARYARRKKPGFAIVLQNAEELLSDPALRNALDAAAKEDLLFGIDGDSAANSSDDIKQALNHLRRMQRDRRPVLAVEYLPAPELRQQTAGRLTALGLIPYFAPRDLDTLGVKPMTASLRREARTNRSKPARAPATTGKKVLPGGPQ